MEHKLTNRDRAIKLYQEKILPSSNPNSAFARERKVESIMEIERALDEADKRAMNAGISAGYKQGKIEGQREMRERAAKVIDIDLPEKIDDTFISSQLREIANEIRALPVDGE